MILNDIISVFKTNFRSILKYTSFRKGGFYLGIHKDP